MKLYVCFLKITKEMKDKIIGFKVPKVVLDWKYDKDDDMWYTLYGWTKIKKVMKTFKNTRNHKVFHYSTITNEENAQYIIDRYMDLNIYSYDLNVKMNKTVKVIMSWFEYKTITDPGFIVDEVLFENAEYAIDPLLFSKSILPIMEQLGYSFIFYTYMIEKLPILGHSIVFPGDSVIDISKYDLSVRVDNFWNCSSFSNDGEYTDEFGIKTRCAHLNELSCFIKVFGELLKA